MSPPPSLVARALAGVEMSKRWALWFWLPGRCDSRPAGRGYGASGRGSGAGGEGTGACNLCPSTHVQSNSSCRLPREEPEIDKHNNKEAIAFSRCEVLCYCSSPRLTNYCVTR
jgi:hypothetical protein